MRGEHDSNGLRFSFGTVAPEHHSPSYPCLGSRQLPDRASWKIERFAGHHKARETLLVSVAGVTAIMLIANLILLIFY